MFSITLYQVAKLFLFMLIGWVLTKTKVLPRTAPAILSKLEIWLFIPSLVFTTFSSQLTVAVLKENASLFLVSVAVFLLTILIGTPIGKLLGHEPYQKNLCVYSINVPNTSFVGTPLVLAMFGSDALMRFLLFTIPLSVYTYSEGFRMLLNKKGFSLKNFLNPPFLVLLIGAAFGLIGIPVPKLGQDILGGLSNCLAPVAMILAGASIADFKFREILGDWRIYPVVAVRMIAIPVLMLLLGKVIGLSSDNMLMMAATLAMPTGLNTVVLPASIGEDCKFGAGACCVSNTLAILSIPAIFALFIA